jgi:hypothetical protein
LPRLIPLLLLPAVPSLLEQAAIEAASNAISSACPARFSIVDVIVFIGVLASLAPRAIRRRIPVRTKPRT